MSGILSGILTLTDNKTKITPSVINPLSTIDPSGAWIYYLYNFPNTNCTLTLDIQTGYVLTKLYYVIYANGAAGSPPGTISGTIDSTNYPGGGGGGGCGQIYPTNNPLTTDSSGNFNYVKISDPVFPYNINANPNAVFNIKNEKGVIASVGYGRRGALTSDYVGGFGGTGGTGGTGTAGFAGPSPGLMGGQGIGGNNNGTVYPATTSNTTTQIINFADGTPSKIKNNLGGKYDYTKPPYNTSNTSNTSDTPNGYGQGGFPGYVMFYYDEADVKKK